MFCCCTPLSPESSVVHSLNNIQHSFHSRVTISSLENVPAFRGDLAPILLHEYAQKKIMEIGFEVNREASITPSPFPSICGSYSSFPPIPNPSQLIPSPRFTPVFNPQPIPPLVNFGESPIFASSSYNSDAVSRIGHIAILNSDLNSVNEEPKEASAQRRNSVQPNSILNFMQQNPNNFTPTLNLSSSSTEGRQQVINQVTPGLDGNNLQRTRRASQLNNILNPIRTSNPYIPLTD